MNIGLPSAPDVAGYYAKVREAVAAKRIAVVARTNEGNYSALEEEAEWQLREFGVRVVELDRDVKDQIWRYFQLGKRDEMGWNELRATADNYQLIRPWTQQDEELGERLCLSVTFEFGKNHDHNRILSFHDPEHRRSWAARLAASGLVYKRLSFLDPAMLERPAQVMFEFVEQFRMIEWAGPHPVHDVEFGMRMDGTWPEWCQFNVQRVTPERVRGFAGEVAEMMGYAVSQAPAELYEDEKDRGHEALRELQELVAQHELRVGQLDRSLTATEALKQDGVIVVDENGQVRLTEGGKAAAQEVQDEIDRHNAEQN